jgi:hypothetical protein
LDGYPIIQLVDCDGNTLLHKAVYKNINKAIEYSIGIFDDVYVTEDCSVIKSSNISKTDVYKYLRTNNKIYLIKNWYEDYLVFTN